MSRDPHLNRPIPSDADASRAWDQVMKIAAEHALICQAYGGVATLATPAAQREAGIRNDALQMGGFAREVETDAPHWKVGDRVRYRPRECVYGYETSIEDAGWREVAARSRRRGREPDARARGGHGAMTALFILAVLWSIAWARPVFRMRGR